MKKYDAASIIDAPVEDVASLLDSCLRLFDEHGRNLNDAFTKHGNAQDYEEAIAWLVEME